MTDPDLVERLERLEKRSKVLSLALVFLAAVGAIILYYDFELVSIVKPPETLVARSIETDRLVAHPIEVKGEAGKKALFPDATRDGWVALNFTDLDGEQQLSFLMTPSGKPSVDISTRIMID